LQPNDLFLFYNIQFVYEYYRIEKQKDILYGFGVATSSTAIAPVSCSFVKSLRQTVICYQATHVRYGNK